MSQKPLTADPTPAVRDRILSLPPTELPAYIYDLATLREHAARVRSALPERVELYYAAKANPEPEILAALGPYVDGYEVSSGGELAHVAKAVPGRPLAFGGPGKTPDEIRAALEQGVERFHVESEHDLRMLAELARQVVPGTRVAVLLRFNLAVADGSLAGSSLAMGGRPTPFGLDPTRAPDVLRTFTDGTYPHLELRGIHAHLASGLDAPGQLAVARSIVDWATDLAVPITEVNIGGGMAVDYADPDTRFDWTAYGEGLAQLAVAHPELTLRIEPGRALTAYCGWYATEVLDVKHSHGEEFAVVRGGTHHLRTPATKGHDQPCSVLAVEEWPYPWPRPASGAERVSIAGQLCTPKDLLARHVHAPGLRAGDRVAFSLAGAYAWNISHHDFLMHPRPGFHFLD
ncbi:type III PLP-dependent enzyme [Streptomyces ipomoeae]|jgi:diaminopimelate decarboxylase|uniref:Pyridoxal-dependent decarboxylase, C-terminal sheet domain protein n=2 Tax=Streptomyces ipomoeae TaxID=103232 RepID=L1KXJ6_9ACTN|nr:type III PLP-dependent enzyme [Streptomyces ipomoeae]EKX65215.1 pyridoxal-dependent decarboxylase, C-terminal sheet domain protein [Streptomyces ipomoeae 91-03]MDX2695256.1 type III PLP-dependent enzyme [Streptomyces ipomoeae]MDX2823542.1 type III PLP-dependent enzyme [Streptomyces ipomoeae]MDX2840999.1 type III PLP-dependent enzyme [Streptomyces ipomoeae]MDX2875671.1 type III PLP-dependent enzyme [Streptomyces ipomoeae]